MLRLYNYVKTVSNFLQYYRLLINPMIYHVAGILGTCSITLIFLIMKFWDNAQFRYVITKLS